MKIKKIIISAVMLVTSAMAQTVVEVNGHNIDERELIPIIQKITRGQYGSLPDDKKQMAQKIAIDQAITMVLLRDEAKRSDIQKTKAYKEEFAKYIKNVVEPTLTYQVWFDRELNKIKVSKKETQEFYTKNKERFNQPKLSQVHHILVKTESEAKNLIKTIKSSKDIKSKFMELAGKMMGQGKEGGVSALGALHKESPMAIPFKNAYMKMKAFTLNPKPIKTQFGFHVIYVDGVQAAQKRTLKEVKPLIVKNVRAQKFEKILKAKVMKLREKAKIEFK